MKSHEKCLVSATRLTMIGLAILFSALTAKALPIDLGLAAGYAVFGTGGLSSSQTSSFSVSNASTVVNGNVGVGPFMNWTTGMNGTINGTLFSSPMSNLPSITGTLTGNNGVPVIQDMSATIQAALDANTAAAMLGPTQTITNFTSGMTIMGNGGLNVIAVPNGVQLSGGGTALRLQGGPSDMFVFQVSGGGSNTLVLSGTTMTLLGDINPGNILWNVTGNQPGVVTISSGANVDGIFLAPLRNISVNNATLDGAVIGGGRTSGGPSGIGLNVSSSTINLPAPAPPVETPEPSTLTMMGAGVISLFGVLRRKQRRR